MAYGGTALRQILEVSVSWGYLRDTTKLRSCTLNIGGSMWVTISTEIQVLFLIMPLWIQSCSNGLKKSRQMSVKEANSFGVWHWVKHGVPIGQTFYRRQYVVFIYRHNLP